jgi:hypothetical protein
MILLTYWISLDFSHFLSASVPHLMALRGGLFMLALGTVDSLDDCHIIVLPFGSYLCNMAMQYLVR